MQQFLPSTVAYEANGSPYDVNSLPLNSYKMRHSLSPSESSSDGCQYGGNTSPPYSATSVPQTLPMVGGMPSPPQQSQTPAGYQQPGPFGYAAPNFAPTSVVDSTTPPQIVAMSVGTPSPSVEMPATFYTHGSAVTFQPANAFGDIINPAVHNLTDLHFVSDTQVLGSNYSARSVPHGQSRVRQTVINDARVRYSGVMPSGHFMHAGGRSHGGGGGGEREATESISQWSQWLKSGAPAGPAPPVY